MGMKTQVTGGDGKGREMPPAGTYIAICNGVYLIGTQPGYNGGPDKPQLMLSFELHKRKGPARDTAGRILEASEIMNNVANTKSTLIEKFAGPLRGKSYTDSEMADIKKAGGFDPESLLGQACKIEIEHVVNGAGKLKDKIKSVSKIDPEDDVVPDAETDEVYWDYTLEGECPKRVAFFWARALENPDRPNQLAGPPAVGKFKQIDPADSPF